MSVEKNIGRQLNFQKELDEDNKPFRPPKTKTEAEEAYWKKVYSSKEPTKKEESEKGQELRKICPERIKDEDDVWSDINPAPQNYYSPEEIEERQKLAREKEVDKRDLAARRRHYDSLDKWNKKK